MKGLEYAKTIPGWMTEAELLWLGATAAVSGSWTELGVYCGRSFAMVALNLPDGALLQAVDQKLFEQSEQGVSFADTIREVTRLRPDLRIVLAKEDITSASTHLLSTWTCFIDADHSYEATSQAIWRWRDRSRILCGHDYNPQSWPGVVKAVDEAGGKPVAGSIWVLE